MDLSCNLGPLKLDTCIFNASGPRTGSSDALSKVASSAAGAILAKSATLKAQDGNPLPRTWQSPGAAMNSEGLPNKGIHYYLSAETVEKSLAGTDKPYILSVSGHTLADNVEMLTLAASNKAISGIELNLACPNVIGHPIIAYDWDQMETVLSTIAKLPLFGGKDPFPLGIKLPPYFDGPHFERAAACLNKYKDVITYTASINTVGNALVIDTHSEMPAINPKGGFGGLSGPAVKYTALANTKKMRELLHESISVVGVGGIESGEDVFHMLLCGADAVQVGTCHWTEGAKCFDRIRDELVELMKSKGYSSVKDFRGQLKPWSKQGATASYEARKAKGGGASAAKGGGAVVASSGVPLAVVMVLIAIIIALVADKLGHINIPMP